MGALSNSKPESLEQWLKEGQKGLPKQNKKMPLRAQARCPTESFALTQETDNCILEVRYRGAFLGRIRAYSLLHLIFQNAFSSNNSPTFKDIKLRIEGELTFASPMDHPHFIKLWHTHRITIQERFETESWIEELDAEGLLPHLLSFTPDDTGWLKVHSPHSLRLFCIVDGQVAGVASSWIREDLLSLLIETGRVEEEQLTQTLATYESTQIARGLVRTSVFSEDEMQNILQEIAKIRLHKSLLLGRGWVRFDHDESARPDLKHPLPLSSMNLLIHEEALTALKTLPQSFLEPALGGAHASFKSLARKQESDQTLGFHPILEATIVDILQKPLKLSSLILETSKQGHTVLETLRALWSTLLMGSVATHQPLQNKEYRFTQSASI